MRCLFIGLMAAMLVIGFSCSSPVEPQQGDYIIGSPLLEIRIDSFGFQHLWLTVESSQQAHARVRKYKNDELYSSWDVIVPCERDIMSGYWDGQWDVDVTTDGITWHQSNDVTF
jgi:hypothetical protein